jgi:hypothetical protein
LPQIDGDSHLSAAYLHDFDFSITAAVFAANTHFKHIHVVVVARIAHLDIATESSLTNEIAFVVKSGIAVATQAKLEVFAFFGALFFRKVHEGNMSTLFVIIVSVAPITVVIGVVPSDVVRLVSGESRRISIFMIVVRLRLVASTPFRYHYGLFFLDIGIGTGINGSSRHFVRRSRLGKSH